MKEDLVSNLTLTDQERAAFCQDIDRNRALDYFYAFDNVPLHFVYHDDVIPGELSEMEERNKALTEKLWSEGYNIHIVGGVSNLYVCATMVPGNLITYQEPFLIPWYDPVMLEKTDMDNPGAYRTLEEVEADFDEWMTNTGRPYLEKVRQSAATGSWRRFMTTPDRTPRVVSAIPIGNEVLGELITTWSEDGVLKEAASTMVLNYFQDGTIRMYRAYADPANWPGVDIQDLAWPEPSQNQTRGVMDQFFDYHRALKTPDDLTDNEKRNLSIVEGAWLDAQHNGLDTEVFHSHRFRMQLPIQKCSFNLDIAKDVAAIVKKVVPGQEMRLGMTYAKGNQVVAEGVVSWNRDGHDTESPFMSFLLLDEDGLIIRERRYLAMDNWPGADRMMERLGL